MRIIRINNLKDEQILKIIVQNIQDKVIVVVNDCHVANIVNELQSNGIIASGLSIENCHLRLKRQQIIKINYKMIKTRLKNDQVIIFFGSKKLDYDYLAVCLAKLFSLKEITFYHQIGGIYSGPIQYINNARLIRELNYNQALDLSSHHGVDISYRSLLEAAKTNNFIIRLKDTTNESITTIIDQHSGKIRTMSVELNYWLITFRETIPTNEKRLMSDCFEDKYIIASNNLIKLQTPYTKVESLVKVHFIGCDLGNDEIYRSFLHRFAIVSKSDVDSYYVITKLYHQDINLLHDLIVRID